MTIPQIRSYVGLAVTRRIAVNQLARRIRAERVAGGLQTVSDTQFAAFVRHAVMKPGKPAEHEKARPSFMTRIIAVLEERGLMARVPPPTDKLSQP